MNKNIDMFFLGNIWSQSTRNVRYNVPSIRKKTNYVEVQMHLCFNCLGYSVSYQEIRRHTWYLLRNSSHWANGKLQNKRKYML